MWVKKLSWRRTDPKQIAEAFSRKEDLWSTKKFSWIFLLLLRKSLFDLILWYRKQGYQADVPRLREAFWASDYLCPILKETDWANTELSYQDL